MKFVAAGDMLLQQRIQHNYPGFDELSPLFAHRCIDKGAHAIIGHGPHLLRAIEV